jgi:GDP-L-fucose synthase
MMNKSKKIFVAGHRGMVGAAIHQELIRQGCSNLITRDRNQLDLTEQNQVRDFLKNELPDEIYIAAAKVGGIHANSHFPADFITQNLLIETNLISEAFNAGIKKILFLGSSCIYPRLASQPIKEDQLLSGLLEVTNEPYAIAKIAGIKLCEAFNRQYKDSQGIDYRAIMPTNLYGPGDNYHPLNSHVIPALIRRFHEAKINEDSEVVVWGTGSPKREFLHCRDLAAAAVFAMELEPIIFYGALDPNSCHLNVGYGSDITIKELAYLIAATTGFQGKIIFDDSQPDGTPRKLLDSSALTRLGWQPKYTLEQGLYDAYNDFLRRAT